MLSKHLPTELPPQSREIQILNGLLISSRTVEGRTWFEEGVSFWEVHLSPFLFCSLLPNHHEISKFP